MAPTDKGNARVREVARLVEADLKRGADGTTDASWHYDHRESACVFVGGLDKRMSEGDVVTVLSQFGEVADVSLGRRRETGEPLGFAHVLFEDQRSTILAIDNLNGASLLERTLHVDHAEYRPAEVGSDDETYPQYLRRKAAEEKEKILRGARQARMEKRRQLREERAKKQSLSTLEELKAEYADLMERRDVAKLRLQAVIDKARREVAGGQQEGRRRRRRRDDDDDDDDGGGGGGGGGSPRERRRRRRRRRQSGSSEPAEEDTRKRRRRRRSSDRS